MQHIHNFEFTLEIDSCCSSAIYSNYIASQSPAPKFSKLRQTVPERSQTQLSCTPLVNLGNLDLQTSSIFVKKQGGFVYIA